MRRWTLAGSMGSIAVVAMFLAAIRESTPVWAAVVSWLVVATFALVAGLGMLRRRRQARCLAFSMVGGIAFLITGPLGPSVGPIPVIDRFIEGLSDRLEPPPPPMRDLWLPRDRWMQLPPEERIHRSILLNNDNERNRVHLTGLRTREMAEKKIIKSLLSLLMGLTGAGLTWLVTWPRWRKAPTAGASP